MLKLPAITDPCLCCPEGVPCPGETKCPVYQNYQIRLKTQKDTIKAVWKWLKGKETKNEMVGRVVSITGQELDEIEKALR